MEKNREAGRPSEATVKERMIAYLKHKRIPQVEFCQTIGVSSAYLGAMRKGIPAAKMKEIRRHYPDLNPDWVLYGEGEMLLEAKLPDKGGRRGVPKMYESMLIPVAASAGTLSLLSEGVEPEDCERVYSPFNAPYAIKIQGDSMEPKFQDGTTLFITKINHQAFIPWGASLVVDTINGVLVKNLYPAASAEKEDIYTPEYVVAKSLNPAYPPFRIPTDTILGIYRIIGSMSHYDTL